MANFEKLKTVVRDYRKSPEGVIIEWQCSWEDEQTLISSPVIPLSDGDLQSDYMRKAFKASKKEIKKWIRSVRSKPSVIGSQYVFHPDEIKDDDDSVNP